jgi:hypothetical protein
VVVDLIVKVLPHDDDDSYYSYSGYARRPYEPCCHIEKVRRVHGSLKDIRMDWILDISTVRIWKSTKLTLWLLVSNTSPSLARKWMNTRFCLRTPTTWMRRAFFLEGSLRPNESFQKISKPLRSFSEPVKIKGMDHSCSHTLC